LEVMVCTSKAFFSYLTVMLASLYESNKDSNINTYVFHSELDSADIEILQAQAENYGNRICPIQVTNERIEALPTRQQWPMVLYYRLMAVDLLPHSIDRILSLDVDIIVRKSLRSFYELDLTDTYVAACEDTFVNTVPYKERLGLSLDSVYFNAGVFLLNLNQMRQEEIDINSFLKMAQDSKYQLTIPDQDLLNLVFCRKTKIVDLACYNCSPILFEQLYGSEKAQEEKFATIIHYLGPDFKPWNTYIGRMESELQNIWWDYARLSPSYETLKNTFEQKILSILVKENLALKVYFGIAHRWLIVENRRKKLETFFKNKGINKVAIYGLSALSEILCRDLDGSEITVPYLIDSFAKGEAYGYKVKNNDGSRFDDVDAIVVAACAHFQEIRSGLHVTCPVLSLEEVTMAIYTM